jgi:hypothetical protein
MEAGALARPIRAPAPFLAVDAESENLSLPPGAILAGNAQCAVCRRTPLVGETVTVYRMGGGDTCACDLCLAGAGGVGEPTGRERVRTTAGALTVRRVG